MDLKFITSDRPVDPDEITRIEVLIGKKLPDDYARFLLLRNGGRPTANKCVLPKAKQIGVGVTGFFGINRDDDLDLIFNLKRYKGRIIDEFIPIGDAEGGNLICLSLSGASSGAIYFWDHEKEASDGNAPTQLPLSKITVSFAAFLSGLKEEHFQVGKHAKDITVRKVWVDPNLLSKIKK